MLKHNHGRNQPFEYLHYPNKKPTSVICLAQTDVQGLVLGAKYAMLRDTESPTDKIAGGVGVPQQR